MRFKLVNIGRGKVTREVELEDPEKLLGEVRKHLGSRTVDILFAEDGKTGTVMVGIVRPVGKVESLDDEAIAWGRGD